MFPIPGPNNACFAIEHWQNERVMVSGGDPDLLLESPGAECGRELWGGAP